MAKEKKERYFVGQIIGSADYHIIDNGDEKEPKTVSLSEALVKIMNDMEEIKESLG